MSLDYDLQSYLNYIFDDKKNYEYVKHITRYSKSNAELESNESNLYFENVEVVKHKHNEIEHNDFIK